MGVNLQNGLMASVMLAAVACAGGARAASLPEPDSFADVQPVSDSELKTERGGFEIFDGLTFDIGVQIIDTLNGQPALVSTLDLNSNGQMTITGNATPITDEEASQLAAATGVDLRGLVGAEGVIVQQNGGVTALVANVTPQLLQNLVINTANSQVITQQTNITLTLPGFQQTQAQLSQASMMLQLGTLLNQSQLSALGR